MGPHRENMENKNRIKNHGMGYSNIAAAKNKNKAKDEGIVGGKVTQYRNIDDIPNLTGDETIQPSYEYSQTQPFSNRGDYYDDNRDEYTRGLTPPQAAKYEFKENKQQSYPMKVEDVGGPMLFRKHEDYSEQFNEDDEINYSSDESSPSLPHPPRMKDKATPYVDARNESRFQQKNGIENAKQSVAVVAAPPLPCDVKDNIEKQLTGKDKLYFSKEPRTVKFK